MKVIKFIINFLLSFILILVICANIGLNIIENNVLNKDYILSKMDEVKFYTQVSREINDGIDNYKYQSGLPEELLENLFDESTVKEDLNSIINNIYDDTEITNHSEAVKELLNERIYNYVDEQKIKLSDEGKANIVAYENYIVLEYVNNVGVSNTLVNLFKGAVSASKTIADKLNYIPVIALVVVIVLLVIVNIKSLLSAINWGGISVLVSGVLLVVTNYYINSIIQFDRVVLFKKSATSLVVNIAKEILYNIQDIGMFMIFCGILSIIVSNVLNNISTKKDNVKEEK